MLVQSQLLLSYMLLSWLLSQRSLRLTGLMCLLCKADDDWAQVGPLRCRQSLPAYDFGQACHAWHVEVMLQQQSSMLWSKSSDCSFSTLTNAA